jgi:hypothetical protein
VTGVIRAIDDWCPSSGGSPPASEFERSGSINELLGEVKHLVGLIRLAVETDADLSRDLVPIAWRPMSTEATSPVPRLTFTLTSAVCSTLGFHAFKCPQ